MHKFRIAASMALASIPFSAHAQVAPPACIPKPQVRDATVVLIPFVVDAARKVCGPKLPGSAFLNSKAAVDFASRLRAERPAREHSAAAAFRTMSGKSEANAMSDQTIVSGIGEVLAAKAVDKADNNRCDDLNGVLEAMSPMSGQQIGVLVTSFFSIANVGGGRNNSPKICAV